MKHKSFSLVELLVSLIAISLITAAFAPVITKKLSAGTITVGSFGGGGSSKTTIIPKSQADCNTIGAQLVYVETDSTKKTGICVTQYNIGDGNFSIPTGSIDENIEAGVAKADGYCNDKKCCWHGATSGTNCDSVNGSYSGCGRTVCNWEAANSICDNLSYGGYSNWRLPTKEELEKMNPDTYSKIGSEHAGDSGLMWCDYETNHASSSCTTLSFCNGAAGNNCFVHCISIFNDKFNHQFLHGGTWSYGYGDHTQAFSTRCVIDSITIEESGGGGSSVDMNSLQKTMCDMLDNKYWDESEKSCKTCSDVIPNCQNCSDNSTCTKCENNYELINDKCVWAQCTISNGLLKLTADLGSGEKTYCITQYNIGDHANYRLPPTNSTYLYGIYNAGSGDSACSANYTTGCCWQGNTTNSTCDSANGSYSGCSRTVCNWHAADNICKNITILDMSGWRLPTQTELGNLNPAIYSKAGTAYAGDDGLMFCDFNAGYNSARCSDAEVCPGSGDGWCYPNDVWSGTLDGSTTAFNRYLYSGSWTSATHYRTRTLSVRCVKEL